MLRYLRNLIPSLLFIRLITHYNVMAQPVNFEWAFSFGDTLWSITNEIVTDDSGNVYSTGIFSGNVDFAPGSAVYNLSSAGEQDIFLTKHNRYGDLLWAFAWGDTAMDMGESVQLDDAGNVYVTGVYRGSVDFDPGPGTAVFTDPMSDRFVMRLSTSGVFEDVKFLNHLIAKIEVDQGGNIIGSGYTSIPLDVDPGPGVFTVSPVSPLTGYANFLFKWDAAWNFQWVTVWQTEYIYLDMDVTGSSTIGEIYAAGDFQGVVDFDPGPDTLALGSWTAPQGYYILKLDSTGTFQWAGSMQGDMIIEAYSMTCLRDSGVLLAGSFNGTWDLATDSTTEFFSCPVITSNAFLVHVAGNGDFRFARQIHGWGSQILDLDHDFSGDFYAIGVLTGSSDVDPGPGIDSLVSKGGEDAFILKLDHAGNYVWSAAVGSPDGESGWVIETDPFGSVIVAGAFADSLDCDLSPLDYYYLVAEGPNSGYQIHFGQPGFTGITSASATSGILVFPNPFTDEFRVCLKSPIASRFTLYNFQGVPVHCGFIYDCDKPVDCSELPGGIYLLQVEEDGKWESQRLVKL